MTNTLETTNYLILMAYFFYYPHARINCFQESKGGGERGGTEAEPKGGGRTTRAEVSTGPRPGAGMSAPAGPREGEEPTGGGRAQVRSLTALVRASTPREEAEPKGWEPAWLLNGRSFCVSTKSSKACFRKRKRHTKVRKHLTS